MKEMTIEELNVEFNTLSIKEQNKLVQKTYNQLTINEIKVLNAIKELEEK